MSKKIISLILFLTLFSNEETFGGSKMDSAYSKNGIFIELSIPYHQISGDFDGKSWFKRKPIEFKLPEAGEGIGFGLSFGCSGTLTKKYEHSIDLNFARSMHKMDWEENKADGILTKFGLNSKFYQRNNKRWQPFIELGFFITRLDLKPQESFSKLNPDEITQSEIIFSGFGGRCGVGVAYHLNRKITMNFGMSYEIRAYSDVKLSAAKDAFQSRASYRDITSGNGMMLNIGLRYSF